MHALDQACPGQLVAVAGKELLGRARGEEQGSLARKAQHRVLHVLYQVAIGIDLCALVDLEHGVEAVGRIGDEERRGEECRAGDEGEFRPERLGPGDGADGCEGGKGDHDDKHGPAALLDRRPGQQRSMHRSEQGYRETEVGDGRVDDRQDRARQQRAVDLRRRGALVLAAIVQGEAEDSHRKPHNVEDEGQRHARHQPMERERQPERGDHDDDAGVRPDGAAAQNLGPAAGNLAVRPPGLPPENPRGDATHY
jgi:hypothetical protein